MAPSLSQDPNLLTQQLILALILTSKDAAAATYTIPTVPAWNGPSATTVWVQSLLYVSLALSLFAALTAVLGKQWLSHYSSVGERGVIEARSAERHRKFMGLKRWHLRTILEFVPILLQASLVLFLLGISAFVFDQQRVVASVVITVNGIGVILYFIVIGLSLRFPDSPFYTPLSSMLTKFGGAISMPFTYTLTIFRRYLSAVHGQVTTGFNAVANRVRTTCSTARTDSAEPVDLEDFWMNVPNNSGSPPESTETTARDVSKEDQVEKKRLSTPRQLKYHSFACAVGVRERLPAH